MESSKHKTQLCSICQEYACLNGSLVQHHIIAYPTTYHVNKGTEDKQNPDNAKHIEEHVSQSGTACLCIGRKGCKVRGNGGSNIFTHYQGDTLIDWQCAT